MCLAVPARIVEIDLHEARATVALGAVKKDISLALLEQVGIGDYVLVHVGFALSVISEDEAQRTLALMREAGVVAAHST